MLATVLSMSNAVLPPTGRVMVILWRVTAPLLPFNVTAGELPPFSVIPLKILVADEFRTLTVDPVAPVIVPLLTVKLPATVSNVIPVVELPVEFTASNVMLVVRGSRNTAAPLVVVIVPPVLLPAQQ